MFFLHVGSIAGLFLSKIAAVVNTTIVVFKKRPCLTIKAVYRA